MESSLLLHKRHQGLSGFRDIEDFFLGSLGGELGGPHALEVGRVGEYELGVLADAVLGQKVLDVVLGDA